MAIVTPEHFKFPCYVLRPDNCGEWRWVYYARNGEEIAVSSEGYTRLENCQRGVEIMRQSASAEIYTQRPPQEDQGASW
jgi:uncharacterized protein YegP (UPF0339 family)